MNANDYESVRFAGYPRSRDGVESSAHDSERRAGCGVLFFRLSRASGEGLGDALAELGMRPAEYAVLHQLAEAGPLSQQALARSLRIHASNLVGLIDELEGAELVHPPPRSRAIAAATCSS